MKPKNNFIKTPILFLIFNRLDTTKQVFEEIRKAKPKKLYVAGDGPRNKTEKKKTDEVRKYILDNINWKCEIKTLFRKKNLGCGKAVSGAITWFFKNEEMGIILEDDCLPSQSFFPYCEELLEKYKNNERIMQISGFNPVANKMKVNEDYFFSYFGSIWGWATWKRAWEKYLKKIPYSNSFNIDILSKKLGVKNKLLKNKFYEYNLVSENKINSWAYIWGYSRLVNNGFTIVPNLNLIKNLGFKIGSTHTGNDYLGVSSIKNAEYKFNYTFEPKYNKRFDEVQSKWQFPNKLTKILNTIKFKTKVILIKYL
jgi:hypothetical protein